MVLGVGQIGCGYESQLEAWYRFLVDPSPPEEVVVDETGKVALQGIDEVLLNQRKAFLRPDSLLAIVLLTDENDCSIREQSQYYYVAQQKAASGAPFHLPRAREICDQQPNDPCCFSCGQTGPKDADGEPLCPPDPACKTPDGKTAYLAPPDDDINVRCWNQKRRFGIDFLYPTDRYVDALRAHTVTNRNGEVVPNPIFSDLDPTDADTGFRTPGLVFFAGIVGVPWQDIARTNADGVPDLANGIDWHGEQRGGFKNADEMLVDLPGKDYDTWDLILGNPGDYPSAGALPRDPFMIETFEPRVGSNPITGDPLLSGPDLPQNAINGNEYSIPNKDDLQYACVFPLVKVYPNGNIAPEAHDCTAPDASFACECHPMSDSPLCEEAPATGETTLQVRAKAYPGIRELQVLKGLGSQGIVASVCPAQLDDPAGADFGYRPAIGALLDRLSF